MKAYRLILSLMASVAAGPALAPTTPRVLGAVGPRHPRPGVGPPRLLANNTCCLREVRPDTADARIDAHRPATDRLGPEWRIPLYEL